METIYIKARSVPRRSLPYFTPDKVYKAERIGYKWPLYRVVNDIGSPVTVRLDCCAWLDEGKWAIVKDNELSEQNSIR
jgi:hypothetical protein